MASVTPFLVQAVELTSETADDGTLTDHTSGSTDGDTIIGIFKPGKGGTDGDAARIEFAGLSTLAVGDTISIFLIAVHQIDDGFDLLAYIDSNSVTASNRINKDAPLSTG